MSVLLFPVQDLMLLEHRLSAVTSLPGGWGAAWAAVNRAAFSASYAPSLRRELERNHLHRRAGGLWGDHEDEPHALRRDLNALRYNSVDNAGRGHASEAMLRDLDALEGKLRTLEGEQGAQEDHQALKVTPLRPPSPTQAPLTPPFSPSEVLRV